MVSSILIDAATHNVTLTENLLNTDQGLHITAVPMNQCAPRIICADTLFFTVWWYRSVCTNRRTGRREGGKNTMRKPCHGYSDRREIAYVSASCSDGHDPCQYPIAESSNVIPEWETILERLALVPDAGV